ncbi:MULTISPECIES: MarR family transcriptional regulator [Arthrobacter]|uniref:MarR family transcriptional regulator n=2 Tax=Arthrobacter TaxID=1663 RepID=A0ABU9KLZ5_9MICC|nr:MarR family transcriptional regulator [Arthrobacter sp. YJM1]MDP5228195.1 MarR family transcriptional regulator [Arthrobacter sp. YJM1]
MGAAGQDGVAHDAAIARIQTNLTTVSRRGSARVRRANQALSPVDHSMLEYIRSHPGCRAIDMAAHFELNRSTVSRQLAALAKLGLMATDEEGSTGRSQALRLTDAGEAALQASARLINDVMRERLEGWSTQELEAFALMLDRFNDAMGEG